MASNITFLDTADTFTDLFVGINTNLGQTFGLLIMFVIFIIIFIMFQNYEMKQILLFEGFILSIIGMLFVFLGWISITYLAIPIILLGVGIFFNVKK